MIRPTYFLSVAFIVSFTLSGCDRASMIKKMTSPEDEAVAKHYIEMLRQNRFEEIKKDLDPSIQRSDIRDIFLKMAEMIPPRAPESVQIVGSHVMHIPNSRAANITFEYQFPGKWILINVATQKKDGVSTIVGFHVNPMPDSLERINRFTLIGKGLTHYVVLLLIVLASLFTLYALVLCIRKRPVKRKWLWIVFIVVGIGKFGINWTTGQLLITPVAIQFFSAGAFAPFYGPWTISVSLPLGAIMFLVLRNRLQKKQLTSGSTGSEPNAAPPGEP